MLWAEFSLDVMTAGKQELLVEVRYCFNTNPQGGQANSVHALYE